MLRIRTETIESLYFAVLEYCVGGHHRGYGEAIQVLYIFNPTERPMCRPDRIKFPKEGQISE